MVRSTASGVSSCSSGTNQSTWLTVMQLDAGEPVDLTMTTVNREPVVEVTLPAEYWPPATALADLSTVVRRSTDKTGSCV